MDRFHFTAPGDKPALAQAFANLTQRYTQHTPDTANVIIVLGGDGAMLESLARYHGHGKPFFGINYGRIGFLMNPVRMDDDLGERIAQARSILLRPLQMRARDAHGHTHEHLAFNEVAVRRASTQSAHLNITIDGRVRLDRLVGDGALVCTATGSTAYNSSAGGPIIPYESNLMALTPICAFRPRRWPGALLPPDARVEFSVLERDHRPVTATADSTDVPDIHHIMIQQSAEIAIPLLFDPDHALEERLFTAQFETNAP